MSVYGEKCYLSPDEAGEAQRLYVKRGYVPDGTGVWYGRSKAQQYGMVENGDDLVLYMSEILR